MNMKSPLHLLKLHNTQVFMVIKKELWFYGVKCKLIVQVFFPFSFVVVINSQANAHVKGSTWPEIMQCCYSLHMWTAIDPPPSQILFPHPPISIWSLKKLMHFNWGGGFIAFVASLFLESSFVQKPVDRLCIDHRLGIYNWNNPSTPNLTASQKRNTHNNLRRN